MVEYNPTKEMSFEEKERIRKEIEEAKKHQIVFDEDSPEMDDKMEAKFREIIAERKSLS